VSGAGRQLHLQRLAVSELQALLGAEHRFQERHAHLVADVGAPELDRFTGALAEAEEIAEQVLGEVTVFLVAEAARAPLLLLRAAAGSRVGIAEAARLPVLVDLAAVELAALVGIAQESRRRRSFP
jgi:hypothetical protein